MPTSTGQQEATSRVAPPPPNVANLESEAPRFARGTMPSAPAVQGKWARPEAGDGMWREPWLTRLGRRALTVPATFLIFAVYLALLPALLVYGLIADGVRRRPLLIVRAHLLLFGIVAWHIVGLTCLFAQWVASLRWLGLDIVNWRGWCLALERWWGDKVIGFGEVLFGMKVKVINHECLEPGPVVVFARHTSIIDTMLPLRLIENWHPGMAARIIKKRLLLLDPCVDAISQRVPRTFVRRGSNNHERELDNVRTLTGGMGRYDALWMYPEGTRFTPKKKARILERLRERHPEAAARAEELHYTLPPRPGGTLALLDQCEGMDIVFCAHTGMETSNRLEHFLAGSLYKRNIVIEFWRIPASEVPKGHEERIVWMHEQWKRVDRWVAERQDADITEQLASE